MLGWVVFFMAALLMVVLGRYSNWLYCRVLRGGSWDSFGDRADDRHFYSPGTRALGSVFGLLGVIAPRL